MLAAVWTAFLALNAPDPLALAWEGWSQCHAPDEARRTCRALAGYSRTSNGTIMNDAEVVLSLADPVIIARYKDPVFVRDEAICGYMKDDLDAIVSVEVDGQVFDETNDVRGVRRAVAQVIRDQFDGEELCTTYEPLGNGDFRPRYHQDGKVMDAGEELVIWVRREDGWRVAP